MLTKSKIISLQCSWVTKLYDKIFHEWKIIPLTLIKRASGECFIFYSNLDFMSWIICLSST